MAKYRLIGFDKLEIGDVGADGAMGGTLVEQKAVDEDSVFVNIGEAETERFYNEGQDAPDMIRTIRNGLKEVLYNMKDMTVDNFTKYFGGTATTQTPDNPGS